MDKMHRLFLEIFVLPAVRATMVLPMLTFASGVLSAPNGCSDFSGNWGVSKEAPYPGMARVEIKDCEVFTMDVIGYWNEFTIGGQSVDVKVYDNELYKQTVRGTWNKDRTELTIEEFSKIAAGFSPEFGSGATSFKVQKWALDPNDPDIFHVVTTGTKFTRDTGRTESIASSEVYYRFKGPVPQDPLPGGTKPGAGHSK